MKRVAVLSFAIAAFALAAAAPPAQAQATFKVPFKFESGGKKFPAGDYVVTKAGDAEVTFKQVATGKETALPFTGKLTPADLAASLAAAPPPPPSAGPVLVFDEVGNFEPSYTEYFTVYVVSEVWLSPQEGFVVHRTKGAHKTKVVKAEPTK